jgi:hypothetical protein
MKGETMQILLLKNAVKTLAAEGVSLRRRIQAASGPERHRLWNEKREVGWRARNALLAYAFARNVPYSRTEPRCRPGNAPRAAWIGECVPGSWAEAAIEAWLHGAAGVGASREVAMG